MPADPSTGLWRHAQHETLEQLVNALRSANLATIHGKRHAGHDRALSAAIEAVQAELPPEMQTAPRAASQGWIAIYDERPAGIH